MPIRFSIVMPTLNRRDSLAVVLPSLINQTYPAENYEILLSDSGSDDGTEELVKSLNSPNLRYFVHENNGRSGARNVGVRAARYETILFTDADIIADPNLLAAHAEYHEKHANCAVVGLEVQVDTLEEYEKVRHDPEAAGRHLHRESRKSLPWLYFLTGNASVSRDKLIEVGIFDENFTGYGHEDLELGYRLQKAGVKILYHPRAINYHWHPVTLEEKCKKMELAGISTVRFWRKHRDPQIKFLLGVTPVSLGLHSMLSKGGWFETTCRRKAQESHLFSEMLLQYHYLNGVKQGMRALGR